jgi:hypothetical protein
MLFALKIVRNSSLIPGFVLYVRISMIMRSSLGKPFFAPRRSDQQE